MSRPPIDLKTGRHAAPWGDLWGKPLDPRGLAKRLDRYGIKPHQIRVSDDHRPQGYVLEDFRDAWFRYLPSSTRTLTSPDKVGQTSLLDTPSGDVRGSQRSDTGGEGQQLDAEPDSFPDETRKPAR